MGKIEDTKLSECAMAYDLKARRSGLVVCSYASLEAALDHHETIRDTSEVDALRAEVERLYEAAAVRLRADEVHAERMDALRSQVGEAHDELTRHGVDAADESRIAHSLPRRIDDLGERAAKAEFALASASSELHALRARVKELESDLESSRASLERLSKLNSREMQGALVDIATAFGVEPIGVRQVRESVVAFAGENAILKGMCSGQEREAAEYHRVRKEDLARIGELRHQVAQLEARGHGPVTEKQVEAIAEHFNVHQRSNSRCIYPYVDDCKQAVRDVLGAVPAVEPTPAPVMDALTEEERTCRDAAKCMALQGRPASTDGMLVLINIIDRLAPKPRMPTPRELARRAWCAFTGDEGGNALDVALDAAGVPKDGEVVT